MNSKKIKMLAFVLCAILVFGIGAGAVVSYALKQISYNSSITVQYKGKRDVYASINGVSKVDGETKETLTEVVLDGESNSTATQNFNNAVTLSSGEQLTFEFTIENNSTYTTDSNLYVLPEITVTLPQNNQTAVTTQTQFAIPKYEDDEELGEQVMIEGSDAYKAHSSQINNCGYIIVEKDEILNIKFIVTVDAEADDVDFSISIAFDLSSDRNLPNNYQNFNNRTQLGYTVTFANDYSNNVYPTISVTYGNGTQETWTFFNNTGYGMSYNNASPYNIQNMSASRGLNIQSVAVDSRIGWSASGDSETQYSTTLTLNNVVSINAITPEGDGMYSVEYSNSEDEFELGALTNDVSLIVVSHAGGSGSN